jgi:chemotaxis protein histidine kinase CheA
VTGSRDASLSRFRASLQTRVRNIRSLFEILEYLPADQDAIRQVLGELHTFKGEARLLGLVVLSELTHALEERVEPGGATDFAKVERAIDVLGEALDENADAEEMELRLRDTAKELFGIEIGLPSVVPEAPSESVEHEKSDGLLPTKRERQRWVQVDAALIDELCEKMGEFVVSFGRLQTAVRPIVKEKDSRTRVSISAQLDSCKELLDAAVDQSWGLRLAPIEPMFRQLEQHGRVLANRSGKEVDIVVDVGSVELERDVVDQVWDSLLHLVQNAIAHGLENPEERSQKGPRGTIALRAASQGGSVLLTVEDDGGGIDPEKVRAAAVARGIVGDAEANSMREDDLVRLLFRPGFSTKDEVGQLSGRGIGLDVVKAKIEALGGNVHLQSRLGYGTKAMLTVPSAITKERVLVVEASEVLYGVPSRLVRAVLRKDEFQGGAMPEPSSVRYRDQFVPLRSLSKALGSVRRGDEQAALLIELGEKLLAVKVTKIVAEQDMLRRPADLLLSSTSGIGASGHLDDGRLVLLLEFGYLERLLTRAQGVSVPTPAAAPSEARRTRVLVVDDSPVVTDLVSEILTSAGLVVEVAHNGELGLRAIDRSLPDLVLSDVEMPGMNGLEMLKAIRDRSQSLPVVMLTTRGSVEDRQRASSLGANAYVLKSGFRSDVLLDVVGRFLRLRP